MKFSIGTIALCTVFFATAQALPTTTYQGSPYDECVKAHGGAQWPYPGPGNCHNVGTCKCLPDGSIACIC
ncbi:hypothetical protein GQ54DRAFT_214798 [Martensiomyces pterosporus]|nr:hypothetical protein GQ54DRAFT_214798 [Martensiomyces pterosporus]